MKILSIFVSHYLYYLCFVKRIDMKQLYCAFRSRPNVRQVLWLYRFRVKTGGGGRIKQFPPLEWARVNRIKYLAIRILPFQATITTIKAAYCDSLIFPLVIRLKVTSRFPPRMCVYVCIHVDASRRPFVMMTHKNSLNEIEITKTKIQDSSATILSPSSQPDRVFARNITHEWPLFRGPMDSSFIISRIVVVDRLPLAIA